METEYQLGQDLRNGRTHTFAHNGHQIQCQRTAQGLRLTLPDGRTATTPGTDGMIEYRGSVSYLLSNPKVLDVSFDREGMAHVHQGTEKLRTLTPVTMNTQALQTATATNRHQAVSEYIQDTVRCLVRTGGMDTAETEQIAITTLADVCRIRITQAREAWITYAAVYAATLIH